MADRDPPKGISGVAPPPPVLPQPTEDEIDLDREIEYAFDTDEPILGRPSSGGFE